MTKPTKARIRRSFERAAASYDTAAEVQRRICDHLLATLPAGQPARLLDGGCGTGYALRALQSRFPACQALALDLSPAMLGQIVAGQGRSEQANRNHEQQRPAVWRLAGDLEQLPLAAASLDLYWSSLAVQWCELAAVLREAARCLRPGGRLALATLGPATFHELRLAFAGIDRYQHTLGFETRDSLAALCHQLGLHAVDLENRQEICHYADLRQLLHAVKAVGANQLGSGRRTGLMSRQGLRALEAAYERQRTPQGLPLTYDVLYLHAQR